MPSLLWTRHNALFVLQRLERIWKDGGAARLATHSCPSVFNLVVRHVPPQILRLRYEGLRAGLLFQFSRNCARLKVQHRHSDAKAGLDLHYLYIWS
jgi:hypothetical protein